jgi:two-component system CheB/CheR fusion protein
MTANKANTNKTSAIAAPVTNPKTTAFPIVGIGASAGGLEALEQFFENMPDNNGMAFVVIQHLDPHHVGFMPELLQRITPMKVHQATNGLQVKPNCVYIIPPNKSMSLLNGSLHLFDTVEVRGLRLPIDIFLRSLAADQEANSVGIILSGMGSDGSQGVKSIKEKNGLVLVQSPDLAKFDGMPRSAIESVVADIVATADQLPAKLIGLLSHLPATKPDFEMDDKFKNNLEKIVILLREQTGHDFSQYKKNTLFRRIERRKSVHQIDQIQNYVRYCQENPAEIEILFKELLIGVTSFFRDAAVWERLKEHTLPGLFDELPSGSVVRAWVVGCSTGEEAYTLAIIFREALERMQPGKKLSFQIFATDLDADAIEIGRRGHFPKSIEAEVSADRLNRYFDVEGNGYKVSSVIREMVVLAPQNAIKDPPFTKLDVLTCRNMLIYMEPELQKKLIALFNYSLNPGGILVLGTAETLGVQTNKFQETDTKLKLFKRALSPTTPELLDFPSSFFRPKAIADSLKMPQKMAENIQSLAESFLLQQFAHASVLVTDKGDIVNITGRTGKYLEPVAGKANWNIYVMAREGLREVLPGIFRKVLQNFDPVTVSNIKIGTNGGTLHIDVKAQRIESPESIRGMVMLVFIDLPTQPVTSTEGRKTGKHQSVTQHQQLEGELRRSYEDLQSTREEMQTSQEELKSTNEELQSTNEELQSTNEELTTSKEEMQSLNEELQTVNLELQNKVNEFVVASNDMKNLLNSTEIATLFLDKELNIRRFTDSITQIIKLRAVDVGRPFTELVSELQYPDMKSHALKVLKTLTSHETPLSTYDGRWFNVRIMPYRTFDDRIDGLVITFNDITTAKKLELEIKSANEALTLSETRYRRLFESAKDGILILDAETGKIVDVNPYLMEMLNYTKEEFVEKEIWDIGLFKDIVANKDKFSELQQKEFVRYHDKPLQTADGNMINVEFISNVYKVNDKRVIQCFIRKK